jgi:autotransporter-associated beta strand protein
MSLVFASTAFSANVWDGGGANAFWNTAGNWDDDSVPSPTADVSFGTAFTSGATINLNGISQTVNSLTFTGATSLNLARGTGSPTLTITSGNITKTSTKGVTIDPNIILGNNAIWTNDAIDSTSSALRINGVISDGANTYGIKKTGVGDLILSGNNTFDGGLELAGGALWLQHNNALGTGTLTMNNAAGLDVWFGAATMSVNNNITFTSSGGINFRSASAVNPYYELNGNMSGTFNSGNFNFRGNAATWVVNGSVNVSGLSAGGLSINSEGVGSYTVLFASNPTLAGAINGRVIVGSSKTDGTAGRANMLLKEAFSFTGQFIDVQYGGGIDTIGGAHASGTATIAPSNSIRLYDTYAGAVNLVSQNTGAITDFATLIDDTTNSVAVRVNSTYQMFTATSGNTYVTQTPTGIVKFSRAAGNTYDGGTTVYAGTLLVTNTSGSATGTGAVAVNAGARLGGTGYITGAVTAADATSAFAPGDLNATGTLHLSGGLIASTGATFNFDLNGVSADSIDFGAGAVTLNGVITFNFNSLGTVQTGTAYSLFAGSGTWSGAPTFVFNNPGGYVLDTTYGGGNGYVWDAANHSLTVQFAAVPEPSTVALLVGAGIGVLLINRRKRSVAR